MEGFKRKILDALEVCGELVGSAIIFVVIALLASLLGKFAVWNNTFHPDVFVYWTLVVLHYLIFVADVYVFVRRIWHHLKNA